MAVCPDTPEFEPWLTAAEVVRQSRGLALLARRRVGAAAGAGRLAGKQTEPDLIADVLAEVGLTEAAKRRVGGFSRGAAQQIKVVVPPPVPADGISGYVSDALVIGMIVSVVIAAFACAVDAKPTLSIFYRTRVRHYRTLLLPRVVVATGGVIFAYLVGLLVAWYETTVLIGAPAVGPVLYTALLGSIYLAFAVTVTALTGTVARSTSGTVGFALVIMLLCPILAELPALSHWMPSALAGAPDPLLRHTASDHFQRAVAGAILLGAAALALASFRGSRREVG